MPTKNKFREKHGHAQVGKKSLLYMVWEAINARCNNENNKSYVNYGGRGIKNEWESFGQFLSDMEASYNEFKNLHGHATLDRINNDGNYSKENCRWATRAQQGRNTRLTVYFKGESACDASARLGGKNTLVYNRLNRGWSLEEAFTAPPQRQMTGHRNATTAQPPDFQKALDAAYEKGKADQREEIFVWLASQPRTGLLVTEFSIKFPLINYGK